ncbi:hypothetical protein HERIO_2495 [Hepatospora eriocheir]|uniref:Uncharacterized protein n=1 Tax=Hepatospora eriocheir TaxID=1081669 RepID=A0A1X0Q6P5_9MICR|nr:hypothetical protein HERIO_2495 [Hepatospora eriocheir]
MKTVNINDVSLSLFLLDFTRALLPFISGYEDDIRPLLDSVNETFESFKFSDGLLENLFTLNFFLIFKLFKD